MTIAYDLCDELKDTIKCKILYNIYNQLLLRERERVGQIVVLNGNMI